MTTRGGGLGITAAASGLIAFTYFAGDGFWPMLVVSVLHAGALAVVLAARLHRAETSA